MKNNLWTQKELAVLRAHYAAATREELLALLPGRSLGSIYRKAHTLHLCRSIHEEWSGEEVDILIRNYPRMPAKELLPLLPGRSLTSIYRKANCLALSAYDNTETDKIIRDNIGRTSLNKIAKQIGSYCSLVRYRAQLLGLL